MAENPEEIRNRIASTTDFNGLEWIRYSLLYSRDEYGDFEGLIADLVQREIEYAPGCPARLTFDTNVGGVYHAFTLSQRDHAEICREAHAIRMTQLEFYLQKYPNLATDSVWIRNSLDPPLWNLDPEQREAAMRQADEARRREESTRRYMEKSGRYHPYTPEEFPPEAHDEYDRREVFKKAPGSSLTLNIDKRILELQEANNALEQQVEQIMKMREDERRKHQTELEGLQQTISSQQREIADLQKRRAEGTRTISEDISGGEAAYVRSHIKEMDQLFYNLSPTEGGGWKLMVEIRDEGERILVDNMIAEAQKYDKEQKAKRAAAAPAPAKFGPIADILCANFKHETGYDCSMSRAVIARLAEDMFDFLLEGGVIKDWQEYDWSTVELFASKGDRFYRLEQANEAFKVFKQGVNSNLAGAIRQREYEDICMPEFINPAFLQLYVGQELAAKKVTPDSILAEKIREAREGLQRCGYVDTSFQDYLNTAIAWYDEQHADFFQVADAAISDAVEKAKGVHRL